MQTLNEPFCFERSVDVISSKISKKTSLLSLSHCSVRIYDSSVSISPITLNLKGLEIPESELSDFEARLRSVFIPLFSPDCRISVSTRAVRVFWVRSDTELLCAIGNATLKMLSDSRDGKDVSLNITRLSKYSGLHRWQIYSKLKKIEKDNPNG